VVDGIETLILARKIGKQFDDDYLMSVIIFTPVDIHASRFARMFVRSWWTGVWGVHAQP